MKAERVGNIQCTVSTDNPILRSYNSERGIVYLSDYNVRDTSMLEEGFKKRYNISEVILAHWIKTRNKKSNAIQITFAQSVVPRTIYIPGERQLKVYPYMARPLLCVNCWGYGQSAKSCKVQERCQECGEGHKVTECEKEIPECVYYGESHRVRYRECPKHKVEEGICKLKQ